jgi:phage shock protein C
MLGGVCAGMGDYFNIDPVLIRLAWAVAFFAGGVGFLAYIIAWIIIPEEAPK